MLAFEKRRSHDAARGPAEQPRHARGRRPRRRRRGQGVDDEEVHRVAAGAGARVGLGDQLRVGEGLDLVLGGGQVEVGDLSQVDAEEAPVEAAQASEGRAEVAVAGGAVGGQPRRRREVNVEVEQPALGAPAAEDDADLLDPAGDRLEAAQLGLVGRDPDLVLARLDVADGVVGARHEDRPGADVGGGPQRRGGEVVDVDHHPSVGRDELLDRHLQPVVVHRVDDERAHLGADLEGQRSPAGQRRVERTQLDDAQGLVELADARRAGRAVGGQRRLLAAEGPGAVAAAGRAAAAVVTDSAGALGAGGAALAEVSVAAGGVGPTQQL